MNSSAENQTLARLVEALAGTSDDAAIRVTASYEPAAGPGTLVFPPTYPFGRPERDGEARARREARRWTVSADDSRLVIEDRNLAGPNHRYAVSGRYVDGELRPSVVIDSFQSQANRGEQALQDACDDGVISFPFLETAGEVGDIRVRVTSLEAPHRSPDAYFRDSEAADGTPFDETPQGDALRKADLRDARAYFRYVPSDLVFGFWDSQRGGRGVKSARVYTSEVIGLDPEVGRRGAVRFDPNNITRTRIAYVEKQPDTFVVLGDNDKAPKGMKEGLPSNVGHGNVPANDANPGVSVTAIHRSAVVSFAALRRFRFPDEGGTASPDVDAAGRAVLAALALVGDVFAFGGPSVFLRSGCDLVTLSTEMVWVGRGGQTEAFSLTRGDAVALLDDAVARAGDLGLSWETGPVSLRPSQRLSDLLAATFASADTGDE